MAHPSSDSHTTWHASPMNGPRLEDTVPRLEAPIYMVGDTSMRDTPDVSTDMRNQLHITESTSDEDEEDSIPDLDSSLEEEDLAASSARAVEIAELPTGLCYDERMRYHAEVSATTGENVHPEDPRRIYYIYKELCEAGLVADSRFSKMNLIARTPLLRIDAREATREECCLVHTEKHYDFVKHTAGMSYSQLENLSQWIANDCPWNHPTDLNDEELIDLSEDIHMDSIYFNSLSYFSAKLSAGAAIDTCRAVVSRKVKNAIAVIRPPGHHAEVQSTMGFCLFNNVCVASRVCQQDFGPSCRKILILDW
jgi:histone deacetylase 6